MARPSSDRDSTALAVPDASAHRGETARLRRTVALIGGLLVVFLVVWRWPMGDPFAGAARYAPIHIGLETASIVAAMLVFGVTWAGYARDRAANVVILGAALFAAGLIDFIHLLSFAGMPDFVTPAGQEKAINFWLSARLLVALAFLVAAIRPWRPLRHPRARYGILAGALAIAGLVMWAGLYHQDWWPRTFIAGQGLTPFKVAAEYVIDGVMVVPVAVFFLRARGHDREYDATSLFAAVAISMLSELAFTLYSDVTDIFNLLGHVYKVIAYVFLYRAMFVASVRQPIERAVRAEDETRRATHSLERLNRELRAISLCNETLVRAEDEATLLSEVCRIVHEVAGYPLAWVGMVEHDEAKSVRRVASAGQDDGYLASAAITWADAPRGRGPTGTAIRTGRTAVIGDFGRDPEAAPWREAAGRRGFRSNIAMPLAGQDGRVFGVLGIYSAAVDAFTADEVRLLEELAGDLAFGVSVLRARDAQAALEAQLRQSQKMEVVGQLAGGIAHDFNNLLAAIRGYGELLRDELPADAELSRSDLEEVLDAAGRAELLTRQLLAFARRQLLVPVVLRPGEILGALTPMLRRVLGEQVELSSEVDPGAGTVRVDPGQLEQVILNLAVNARDAMPGGGRLTIGVTGAALPDDDCHGAAPDASPAGYVVLTVRDAGVGMDAETQAHLFEPFFTTKPEGRGTGLGLATVYGIVRQSGGSISITSAPGMGTTVRVYLPRAGEATSATPEPSTAPSPSPCGSETVLLVEDDPAVRGFAGRVLRSLGYAVLEAGTGADALGLAAAHAGAIDALVTDIVMPGMPGTTLAARLAEQRPNIRVLYMSGFSSGALSRDVPSDVAFLGKPFSGDALGRALRAVIDGVAVPAA